MPDKIYLLINNEELAQSLAKKILARQFKNQIMNWSSVDAYVAKCKKITSKSGLLTIDFAKVNEMIDRDLQIWRNELNEQYKLKFRKLQTFLANRLEETGLDRQWLIDLHLGDSEPSFTKNIGQQLADEIIPVTRQDYTQYDQLLLLRNIVNNEVILSQKMRDATPFWFVDSGYTNFLGKKKLWHRLIKNHVHHLINADSYWPTDRLKNFPTLPLPWHYEGSAILVIESSEQHYRMNGTNLNDWRLELRKQIGRYTDREVIFKPKLSNKKTRESAHELMSQDPKRWYCVVSDDSSAAIEAIWLGIPAITLRQHITNPVTRSSVADINRLYRGNLANWLCAVSYSQFTVEELYNGVALEVINRYHV